MDWPKAKIALIPQGSQIFIFVMSLAALTCVWCAKDLIGAGNLYGTLFFVPGLAFGVAAFYGFNKSHAIADLAAAHNAIITGSKDETKVSLPPSVFFHKDAVQTVLEVINASVARQPLPAPSGKVDAAGAPIPELRDQAINEIAENNTSLSAFERKMISDLYHAQFGSAAPPPSMEMNKALSNIHQN